MTTHVPRGLSLAKKQELVRKWNDREPMSRFEIAAMLGISRERVRQIEVVALDKIRLVMEESLHGRGAGR